MTRRVATAGTTPAPGGSLSDGVIVEATVVARLLGLKILRVHAHVILSPARFLPTSRPPIDSRTRTLSPVTERGELPRHVDDGTLSDAVELLAHAVKTLQ